MLGNLVLRQAILIVATGIVRQVQHNGYKGLGPYLGRLRAAYRRGRRSRKMLSVPYEKLWDRQVSELAELLCAPRVTALRWQDLSRFTS